MFPRSLRAAASAPALAFAAFAAPAFAQDVSADVAPAPADDTADDQKANDVIIVVGQKDAPITVVPRGLSVSLGQEQFDAINAVNVEDLMKYAPNFFIRKRYV